MDRVNGNNTVDIGDGRRGFRSQNAAAGIAGTEVTDKILNDLQEEICAVVENAGLELDPANQQQLWEALQSIAAPGFANRTAWLPVISLTEAAPPNNASLGDAYIIPTDATGVWSGNQQKFAEWTGSKWRIINTPDGHGVGLPDGRVFEKVDGVYIEKIALDVQSGKWNYAVAGGTANALITTFTPALTRRAGLELHIRIVATNTGAAKLNGVSIKQPLPAGGELSAGDLRAGDIVTLIDDGDVYRLQPTVGFMDNRYSKLIPPPATVFYVVGPTGNDNNSGLANTAADGFATISGAIATLNNRYSSLSRITLNVAAGTYEGFSVEAGNIRSWRIVGAGVTSTIVDASTTAVNSGRGLLVTLADVIVQRIRWKAYFECVGVSPQGGTLEISDANHFEMASSFSYAINAAGGQIGVYGNVGFSGSGISCVSANGGAIRLGFSDSVTTRNVAFNWTAGVTLSKGNIGATDGGSVVAFASAVFQDGVPTGKKYEITLNGTVNTFGAGVGFFAGTVAGTTATGGQYV